MLFGRTDNNILKFVFTLLVFCNCITLVACQTNEEKVSSALLKCQQLLDKNDLSGAFICYGETSRAYPEADDLITQTGEEAVLKKCVEYKDKKDLKNALICFEGAVGVLPDKANVYFLLADAYYQYAKREREEIGFYPDFDLLNRAEEATKKGLKLHPKDAPAHALYGEILSEKGDWTSSVNEFKEAASLKPEEDFYWMFLGIAQEKAGKSEEAVESYKRVLNLKPDKTLALYYLGKLYENIGKIDEAIETFEKLLLIDPNYDDAKKRTKALKERREQQQKARPLAIGRP